MSGYQTLVINLQMHLNLLLRIGSEEIKAIRDIEAERGITKKDRAKVIMTTALNEERNVKMAFELGCTIYSGKPIDQERFEQVIKRLGLI